jgi:hyperosmotically inducible protein
MQQETQPRRKSFSTLLPLAVGALAMGGALVACDRPMQQADSSRLERREAAPPEQRSVPLPAAPREAPERPALPPRDALTDTVISGKIKTAILTDPGMAGADVSVNTDRGVVQLAGVVKSPEQTAIASAHAQRQDGVMRVDNHLSVPPT